MNLDTGSTKPISQLVISNLLKLSERHTWFGLLRFFASAKYAPKAIPRISYLERISKSLVTLLRVKQKYHTKYKKFGYSRDYDTFTILRARVTLVYDQCFKGYKSRIEENIKTDVRTFGNMQSKKKRPTICRGKCIKISIRQITVLT